MSDWVSDPTFKKDSGDWVSDPNFSQDEPEENNVVASGARKLLHGFEGGFSDELAGVNEAATRMVGGVNDKGQRFAPGSKEENDISPTLDWHVLKDAYLRARDHRRDELKKDHEDHPIVSGAAEFGGAILSPLNKIVGGMSAAKGGLVLGGINGLGNSDADNVADLAKDTVIGGGLGAGAGAFAEHVVAPAVGKASQYLGNSAKNGAEKLAENATGATGKQSEKFADGAGRELLDRKLVRFGDNASDIAKRTSSAMDDANAAIDQSLKALDAKGAKASSENIIAELQNKISDLQKDPSQAGVVRKLKAIVEDIAATGEKDVSLTMGEQTKRGFNKAAGNWMDPEAGQAGKTAYQAYRNEVEGAANSMDSALADKFTEGKKTFGLLSPINEAAERRAATLNQSPFGGLLDVAAAGGAGGMVGGPMGILTGVGAAVGRRVIAPRLAASGAVTLDAISKSLLKNPEMVQLAQKSPQAFQALVHSLEEKAGAFGGSLNSMPKAGEQQDNSSQMQMPPKNVPPNKDDLLKKTQGSKYSQVLQNAANNGDDSFSAAHFVLSSRDPDYRKQIGFGDDEL